MQGKLRDAVAVAVAVYVECRGASCSAGNCTMMLLLQKKLQGVHFKWKPPKLSKGRVQKKKTANYPHFEDKGGGVTECG